MPKVYVLYSPPPKDEVEGWSCRNWTEYSCLSMILWIGFLGIIGITTFWITAKRGGFHWGDDKVDQMFNIHPFLMILGFIVFEGISISLYRVCRCCRRVYIKAFHCLLHIFVIFCAVGGYLAVNGYSNNKQNKRKYSAHSWVGMLTGGLFLIQFIIGFVTFLILTCCNRATGACRADMVPLHAAFGIANYAASVAAVATGMQEKLYAEKTGKGEGVEDGEIIFVKILLVFVLVLFLFIHHVLRREELRFRAHLPNFQEEQ